MTELIVTVNAPGEVSGWFLPLARAVKRVAPHVTLRAVLAPCPFAGGREREILRACPDADEVVDLWPYMRAELRARRAANGRVVLHLGGERATTLLLAKVLRAPAWVYGTSGQWARRFTRCLVPDEHARRKLAARGVASGRIGVVGQLVSDSVPQRIDTAAFLDSLALDPERHEIVSLLAGSRPYENEFMLPFYAGLIDELAVRRPAARCLLPWSDFVDHAVVRRALAGSGAQWTGGPHDARLVTARGAVAHIVHDQRYAAIKAARLIVTLPGTNTLQAAALGAPMLVVAPLNRIESMVVEGPLNWLSPRFAPTRVLKRALLLRMNERLRYLALPNIIADEPVVPEARETMTPARLCDTVVRLLDDAPTRATMAARLPGIAGAPGAAQRIAHALVGDSA